jgi:hypothetical protein
MRTALAVILFSIGCASQKPAQTQLAKNEALYSTPGQAKPKGTMHCHMEQETGSNRMERVCSYQDEKPTATDSTVDDAMIKMEQRAAQHVSPGQGGSGQ